MNNEHEPNKYMHDELLQKEAGGNLEVLQAIAVREYLIDLAAQEHTPLVKPQDELAEGEEPDNLLAHMYWRQLERVEELKHRFGVNDPPPRQP